MRDGRSSYKSGTNLTRNCEKAWDTISKLNTEKKLNPRDAEVTPNQVANQLILYGKFFEENLEPFTLEELEEAIKCLKLGKAAGLDGITTEMIQQFGTKKL